MEKALFLKKESGVLLFSKGHRRRPDVWRVMTGKDVEALLEKEVAAIYFVNNYGFRL